MRIFEVLEYGPIVAQDEDAGLLVTVNGSYLNLWVLRGNGEFDNTECRALDSADGLFTQVMDHADEYLKEVVFRHAMEGQEDV
jgi:hypothetical protein